MVRQQLHKKETLGAHDCHVQMWQSSSNWQRHTRQYRNADGRSVQKIEQASQLMVFGDQP